MASIAENILQVRGRISSACRAFDRLPSTVHLLAVSKTCPGVSVREAFAAGQRDFGENYVQEALAKIAELADLRSNADGAPRWHLIGPLQSNKAREVATHFDWVHSIDRMKLAQRLSDLRPPGMAPLQVCLQVNISGEDSKSGVAPEAALALAREVATLPRLKLRGLMAIPAPAGDLDDQRAPHRALRRLLEALNGAGLELDTLSIGMSTDLEAAIAEGATWVRVGTAIFGSRPAKSAPTS